MPQQQPNKSQITRNGQMNKADLEKTTRDSRPRDDINSAYDGDSNSGPAKNRKPKSAKSGRSKGRRLATDSDKTPIR